MSDDLRAALDVLDIIDGIVDDTHPEGDGCPLCVALDDLRERLAALATSDGLDVERAAEIIDKHIIRVARYYWPTGGHIETFAREALAALRSTPEAGSRN